MARVNIIEWIAKKLKSLTGIVEDGDTATHTISAGKYVIWKGNPCKASSAISIGDALSSSNLTALTGGVCNDLADETGAKVDALNSDLQLLGTDIGVLNSKLTSSVKVTNCDDATDPTINYYCESGATNSPNSSVWFLIKSFQKSGVNITQVASVENTQNVEMYVRSRDYNNVWGKWKKIAFGLVDSSNATSYTFDAPRQKPGAYTTGLMYGATGSGINDSFLYIVFVNTSANNNTVAISPIKANGSYTFSGSYDNSTNRLTITSSNTVWGGLNLIWNGN